MGARRTTSACTLNTPNISSTKAATASAEKNVPRAGVSAQVRRAMDMHDSTACAPYYSSDSKPRLLGRHASSTDLLHWEDWPVAMWPDRRYDVAGVYSGNTFIDDDGFPCALYTGNVAGHAEAYGVLARSTDGWLTWH